MRTKYLPAFLIVILLFSSCRVAFEVNDLKPGTANLHKLPILDFQIDPISFRHAFPVPITTEEELSENELDAELYYVATSDVKYHDTKILAERMIRDNVCKQSGKSYGFAICKVIARNTRNKAVFFSSVSLLFAALPNVLGMPYANIETVTELEFEIFNSDGERLGIYSGSGKENKWVGFYYGSRDADRMTNIAAVKQALDEIQTKMYHNFSFLRGELIKAGPIGEY